MMRRARSVCVAAVMICAVVLEASASQPANAPLAPGVSAALDSVRAVRGASLTVSLLTYGHSDVFFERFGHTALAFRDSTTGEDVAYNWGMFDFDQPRFLMRFLTGDTRYSMAGYNTVVFNSAYRDDNRSIREQILSLSPIERGALLEYVQWNAQEENRYYRYDYYQDNCATRIRDVLDWALQGRLHVALAGPGDGRTWRGETARLLSSKLLMYLGIEMALGRHADIPLTQWEEEFLPEHMARHYASLQLPDASGTLRPLVQQDSMVYVSSRPPLPVKSPSFTALAFLIGLTIAGLIVSSAEAHSRTGQLLLATSVALWYLVGGLLGTALLLAGTVTKHAPYMGNNAALFVVHPLLLLAAGIVPVALFRHIRTSASMGLSVVVAVLALVGVVVQFLPGFAQGGGVIEALMIPVHVAIAVVVIRMGNSPASPARKAPTAVPADDARATPIATS